VLVLKQFLTNLLCLVTNIKSCRRLSNIVLLFEFYGEEFKVGIDDFAVRTVRVLFARN